MQGQGHLSLLGLNLSNIINLELEDKEEEVKGAIEEATKEVAKMETEPISIEEVATEEQVVDTIINVEVKIEAMFGPLEADPTSIPNKATVGPKEKIL